MNVQEKYIPEELKINLAAARVNRGLTQLQVAEHMNVSNKTIVNWEKGISSPDVTQADELCRLYCRTRDSIRF